MKYKFENVKDKCIRRTRQKQRGLQFVGMIKLNSRSHHLRIEFFIEDG